MNMMTPRMPKITFTAVLDPPPLVMGPSVAGGALTTGGVATAG
jgi:hypothetical protein